jgi:predicted TIM-barrel fold metal-dependent hydrolase
MLITDAQVHLWEVDRPDRPWPTGRNEPHRPDGWSAGQMLAEMDAIGVDRAVIVPPTWVGEGNETALEAAAAHPARFAVMGRFDVDTPDAADRLQGWLAQPHMLGIRMTFGWAPRVERLDDGSLDWYWAACEDLRIPLMLNVPGMVDKAGAIARRHPWLTVIVDHMGVAHGEGPETFAALDRLLALADLPNMRVKVSCVPNYSAEAYPYRDIQPFLRRMYESFGPRRLLWGADITRLKSSYAECLGLFQDALGYLSSQDREWILGKALAHTLNWPEGGDS